MAKGIHITGEIMVANQMTLRLYITLDYPGEPDAITRVLNVEEVGATEEAEVMPCEDPRSPYGHLDLSPMRPCWTWSNLQNKVVLYEATKSVVICYSSRRKLTHCVFCVLTHL